MEAVERMAITWVLVLVLAGRGTGWGGRCYRGSLHGVAL